MYYLSFFQCTVSEHHVCSVGNRHTVFISILHVLIWYILPLKSVDILYEWWDTKRWRLMCREQHMLVRYGEQSTPTCHAGSARAPSAGRQTLSWTACSVHATAVEEHNTTNIQFSLFIRQAGTLTKPSIETVNFSRDAPIEVREEHYLKCAMTLESCSCNASATWV